MILRVPPIAICPEPHDPYGGIERIIGALRGALSAGQDDLLIAELIGRGLDPSLLHMCLIASKILMCDSRRVR